MVLGSDLEKYSSAVIVIWSAMTPTTRAVTAPLLRSSTTKRRGHAWMKPQLQLAVCASLRIYYCRYNIGPPTSPVCAPVRLQYYCLVCVNNSSAESRIEVRNLLSFDSVLTFRQRYGGPIESWDFQNKSLKHDEMIDRSTRRPDGISASGQSKSSSFLREWRRRSIPRSKTTMFHCFWTYETFSWQIWLLKTDERTPVYLYLFTYWWRVCLYCNGHKD